PPHLQIDQAIARIPLRWQRKRRRRRVVRLMQVGGRFVQLAEDAVDIVMTWAARPTRTDKIVQLARRIRLNAESGAGLRCIALTVDGRAADADNVFRLQLEQIEPVEDILVPVGVEPDPALLMQNAGIVSPWIKRQPGKVAPHAALSSLGMAP